MSKAKHVSALRKVIDVERLRKALRSGTGKGIKVCVIDSGADGRHPSLAGKIKSHFDVLTDGMGVRCVPGEPTDSIGHGTACTGIILQLAPEAEIHTIKVIGASAKGTAEQLVAGLSFALDQEFDIINMSLGTTDERHSRSLGALADRAFHEGRVLVAAANNLGQVAYPAQFASVIGVDMEGFENPESLRYDWGRSIELFARGVYVEAPAMGGGTQLYTGTSFACPHVTGLLARLISVYPGLAAFEARFVLSLLASTAKPE
jgi:subtilisin family serine protease